MRFASWNLRYCGVEGARRRVDYLRSIDWDVLALQEVSRRAGEVIKESGIAESEAYALDLFETIPVGTRHHGAALLTCNGFKLSAPKLILGLPKAERVLVAKTTLGDTHTTIASWHAPNAASEGVVTKMQGYQGIVDWLGGSSGPIVLGFDGNHWNRTLDLELKHVPDSADPWLLENRFFAANSLHRMRDAVLDHLSAHPQEYEQIKELRPQGPLAVSYIRGSKKYPVEDRFDYVFVSGEMEVRSCSYDYKGATAAGSDHALVTADLHLRQ